jgi:serine/threonine-protein kinase RsbT
MNSIMKSNKPSIKQIFNISAGDFSAAGSASSSIKNMLKRIGIDDRTIRRVAVATYEAEMNIAIHSLGGTLYIEVFPDAITIIANDKGPGIKDTALAMEEGYSTAPDEIREMGFGAGMGLPNMKKCSDEFNIESTMGVGTRVEMKMYN